MSAYFNGLLLSLSFFSIIPIKLKNFESSKEVYRGMLFSLPFVGLTLGLLVWGVFSLLSGFLHPLYAAFISGLFYLVLYGFLHLEAVCDVIDAWFAALSGKDIYAIMKEPTIGAIGAIGTFVVILLKVAAIAYLLYAGLIAYFIVTIMLSRLAMLFAINGFSFHEGSFIANSLKKSVTISLVMFGATLYMSIAYVFVGLNLLWILMLSLCVMFLCLIILRKKFGFLNGDCLGFSLEMSEVVAMNLILILLVSLS